MHTSTPEQIETLYGFFAQSMHYPEHEWCNRTYLDALYTLLQSLGGTEEKDQLESCLVNQDRFIEDLQVEHTRLFINGFPYVAAPPYGSVYINKSLKGSYSDRVLQFYHDHGYVLRNQAELPDKLTHQLEMLSFLARDNDREAEKKFLDQFFLPWFPIFAQKVVDKAEHPFYPIIIRIIDFFTKEEKANGV